MKIYIKEPGKNPRAILVPNELEILQKLVGGYIEAVTLEPGWTVICNEEGRWHDLPDNCEVYGVSFVGTILFIGVSEDEFCNVPFSLAEMKQALPALFEEEK